MFIEDDWFPSEHQDLFNLYVQTRISQICEFSCSQGKECLALKKWAELYAQKHELYPPSIDWEDYIHVLKG